MKKWVNICAFISVLSFGGAIFYIKYQVLDLERALIEVQRDIYQVQESVHVLNAEWAYLNEPKRLQKLAAHHLDLKPARPMQLVSTRTLGPEPGVELHEGCETLLCQNQMASTLTQ